MFVLLLRRQPIFAPGFSPRQPLGCLHTYEENQPERLTESGGAFWRKKRGEDEKRRRRKCMEDELVAMVSFSTMYVCTLRNLLRKTVWLY